MATDYIEKRWMDKLIRYGSIVALFATWISTWTTLKNRVNEDNERIVSLQTNVTSLQDRLNKVDGSYSVSLTRVTEQIASINRRTERMEDLLQQTLYQVSQPKKNGR